MSRRGVYRGVYSVLQNDPDFRRLSPPARHTFLSMRLAEYVGIACLWRYDVGIISAQTGYPQEFLHGIFIELEKGRWVIRDGEFMWLRNGLRHDPTLNLGNPKHSAGVLRAISGLPRIPLLRKFCRYYHLPYPFDTHPKGNGIPSDRVSAPNPNPNPNPNTEPRTVALATGPTVEEIAEHGAKQERQLALLRSAGLIPPARQNP